jgi:hypothetical protein
MKKKKWKKKEVTLDDLPLRSAYNCLSTASRRELNGEQRDSIGQRKCKKGLIADIRKSRPRPACHS